MPGTRSSAPKSDHPGSSRRIRATPSPRTDFRAPSSTTMVCSVSSRETPGGSGSTSLPTNLNRPRRSRFATHPTEAWHTPQSASYTTTSMLEAYVRVPPGARTGPYPGVHARSGSMVPETDRLAAVGRLLLEQFELRRPGIREWTPQIEASLRKDAEGELQGMEKQARELGIDDPQYWLRVRRALDEILLPRYAALATEEIALARRDYGIWRDGDLIARATFALAR